MKEHKLGTVWLSPLDVILDEGRALVVQPDLFFVARDRVVNVPPWIDVAPELIVEVLCPRPRVGNVRDHLDWYATYGVKECWLIHAFKQETDVLQFGEGVIREHQTYEWRSPLSSMVLPDFHPVLDEIIDQRMRSPKGARRLRRRRYPIWRSSRNRLESLAGNRKGQHSIRINEQYRICFVWRDGDAFDVEIVDYH